MQVSQHVAQGEAKNVPHKWGFLTQSHNRGGGKKYQRNPFTVFLQLETSV
jgi:hypothetical protein